MPLQFTRCGYNNFIVKLQLLMYVFFSVFLFSIYLWFQKHVSKFYVGHFSQISFLFRWSFLNVGSIKYKMLSFLCDVWIGCARSSNVQFLHCLVPYHIVLLTLLYLTRISEYCFGTTYFIHRRYIMTHFRWLNKKLFLIYVAAYHEKVSNIKPTSVERTNGSAHWPCRWNKWQYIIIIIRAQ